MDTGAANRSSGIPRPLSRLPLPRSGIPTPSATRPQPPSSETPRSGLSHAAAGTLSAPRLRATASREQLNASSNLRRPQRPNGPPVSSQPALRDLGARSRTSSREHLRGPSQNPQEAHDGTFKKPFVPRRRPSGQLSLLAQQASTQGDSPPSAHTGGEGDLNELPPLANPEGEGLTFDTLFHPTTKPRPSLTERTIETLSQLPSSPAIKRRGSNFFDTEPSRRPQSKGSGGSRPGSSYQSDGSRPQSSRSRSRPGSSSGPADSSYGSFRASTNTYKPSMATVHSTPAKRSAAVGSTTPTSSRRPIPKSTPRSGLTKVPSMASLSATIGPRTPSPEKQSPSVHKYGSKTLAVRPLKPRASINGLFKKPSMTSLEQPKPISQKPVGVPRKASLASAKTSSTSGEGRNLSSASTVSTAPTTDSDDASASANVKSSAALREQIAKAKAAKRAASRQASGTTIPDHGDAAVVSTDNGSDFGLADDPFGQQAFESSNRKVMQARIGSARTTGRLNIAAMGLKEIPDDVLKMYDLNSIGRSDGTWAESVDLTRLVAADNELEIIDDAIFPDIDPQDLAVEEDVDDRGRIFWGLESADLHNNTLISLPTGFGRLSLLTSLNLTSNKLTNNCIQTISRCSSLRDLKLGNNLLYGVMEDGLVALENLEILDLHGNNLSALPSGIDQMKRLRILNLDENTFEMLPFRSLSKLPLTELLVRKNRLGGALIESGVEGLPQLQLLDCSSNQLEYLVSPAISWPLSMPSLHQLTVSMNRLKALPDMSSWSSILTVNADDNSITAFPEGFLSRETLRHAGFSSNDIRVIPAEIARMDNLSMLRITGNPLRDKKFTSLTTDELKDALAARLAPPLHEGGELQQTQGGFHSREASLSARPRPDGIAQSGPSGDYEDEDDEGRSESDNFATPPTSAPQSPARSRSYTGSSQVWPVKPGGVLDRTNTDSSSLHPVVCSKIAASQSVREVRLQHNTFTLIPNSLSFFADTITTLSISHNQLTGESWLTEQMDLTALKELNLQCNFCTSLTPLTTYLCAPNLEKLDVSCNRIVRIPSLRDYFPSLTVLLISNNRLEELDPGTVEGMKIVDASNNDIAHLNPRLGLQSLERLDVMGNRFRVPRWNVLERGTEATLRWLRGRVPVAEMSEWRAKRGEQEEPSNEFDPL
ncbi:L domain-like protein [Xylariaceae sp. FL0804]|nr:L domain-like protein [Xylariaceae sp. FL0804]